MEKFIENRVDPFAFEEARILLKKKKKLRGHKSAKGHGDIRIVKKHLICELSVIQQVEAKASRERVASRRVSPRFSRLIDRGKSGLPRNSVRGAKGWRKKRNEACSTRSKRRREAGHFGAAASSTRSSASSSTSSCSSSSSFSASRGPLFSWPSCFHL